MVFTLHKNDIADKGDEKSWFILTFFFSSKMVQKVVPVGTQRRFNIYKTSIRRRRHRIDVL